MDYGVTLALLIAILIVLTLQLIDDSSSYYPVVGGELSEKASVVNVLMFLLKCGPLTKEQQRKIYLDISKLSQHSSDSDEVIDEFVNIVSKCENFSKESLQKSIAELYKKTRIIFTDPKSTIKETVNFFIVEETLDKLDDKLLTH